MARRWIAVSGSWRKTNAEVEADVRSFVRNALKRGDGIVTGGALNVDFFATDEALRADPTGGSLKVCLPVTLDRYAAHYRKRAAEGVISSSQVEALIAQLEDLKRRNADALVEHAHNTNVNERTYYERNSKVLELADELAAFQVNDSPGVEDTVTKARAMGKPVNLKTYRVP